MKQQPPKSLVESSPEGTAWFGGTIEKSALTLRFFGDDIIPEEITSFLGHEPTASTFKGEMWTTKSGRECVAKSGSWRLEASDMEPADLDSQIDWILSRLTDDLQIWKRLTERFKVDMFSGLFLEAYNRGITISPHSMKQLGDRGIELGFDIYCNEED